MDEVMQVISFLLNAITQKNQLVAQKDEQIRVLSSKLTGVPQAPAEHSKAVGK